tara:strand:- start:7339 stop:10260 length:2922 start_codon:yes stop_codon:yes gene_type:complete
MAEEDKPYDTPLGPLETISEVLDKSSTLSRELIKQVLLEQELDARKLKGSFTGAHKYPPSDFRQDVYKELGVGDVEENWPEWLKTGADFATEFLSVDALLLAPAKGMTKLGAKGLDVLKTTRVADSATSKWLLKQNPKNLGRMSVGAIGGLMAQDEDDSAGDIAKKMLLGSGVVAGGLALGAGFREAIKAGDATLDWFNKVHRPKIHEDMQRLLPDIVRTGKGSTVSINDLIREAGQNNKNLKIIKSDYLAGLEKIEKGLLPDELELYNRIRMESAALTTKTRTNLLKAKKAKIQKAGIKLRGASKQRALNNLNDLTNTFVGRETVKRLIDLDAPDAVVDAMTKFKQHNIDAIKAYNKHTPNDFMVGFDFYMPSKAKSIDEIIDSAEEMTRANEGFRMMRKGEIDFAGMTSGQIRELTAERFIAGFMTSQQKTSRALLKKMQDTPINEGGFFASILKGYDAITKNIVIGHLFMHHSWIVTNYADNILRAYTGVKKAGGSGTRAVLTAAKAAGSGATGAIAGAPKVLLESNLLRATKLADNFKGTNTFNDLLDASHPVKGSGKAYVNNELMEVANITGVIDNSLARDMYMHLDGGEYIKQFKGIDALPKGKIENFFEFFQQTTGRLGAAMEADARLRTFKGVLDSLMTDSTKKFVNNKKVGILKAYKAGTIVTRTGPVNIRKIVDKASEIVEDTFFDYSNITNFEKQVMKRVAPYYTFAAKNTKFWFDVMTDPDMVRTANQAFRAMDGFGRTPTKEERRRIPKYLLEEGVKVLGEDKNGRLILTSTPTMSQREAIKEVAGALSTVIPGIESDNPTKIANKLNPLIRAATELTMNKDFFTGRRIRGTEDSPLKRRVFNDALVTEAIFNKIPLLDTDVIKDKRGGLWVKDNESSTWVTVRKNVFPLRLPEAMVGAYRDIKTGKRTPKETLLQYLTPIKVKGLTPKQQKYEKSRKKAAYTLRKRIEKERKQRREERN